MPRYRVLIHGRNFLIDSGDGFEANGFYTPRYAVAPDAVLAASSAVEDFVQGEKYKEILSTCLNADGPQCPKVEGIDVEECEPDEDFDNGLPGVVFYNDEEEKE